MLLKICGFGRFFSQLRLVKANQSCAPGGGILSDAFLSLLCTHCAPTLSGVKPACIFTLHKENIPGWQTELSSCRSLFSGNGLRLRVLCGCRRHLVIMVYLPCIVAGKPAPAGTAALFCRRAAIPFQWGRDVCWMSFRGGCAVQKQAVSPTRSACSWVILWKMSPGSSQQAARSIAVPAAGRYTAT